jgi:hypothetical protein
MNPLTSNPDMALTIAHRTIDDRINEAQQRAQARAARASRRAARQPGKAPTTSARNISLPVAAFRLLRPARRIT